MAHSIQNTVGFVASVLQNTQTVPMTLGTGTNRKVIACLIEDSSTIHSDITYDGVSFGTAVFSVISSVTTNCKTVWYIYDVPDAKPAGTYNIVYSRNFSTTQVALAAWQTVNSVLGGPASTTSDEGTTTETILSTTISCENNSILLAAGSNTLEGLDWAWSGGTVIERYEGDGLGQTVGSADALITGAGTKTVTATISAAGGNMVLGAISINGLSEAVSSGTLIEINQAGRGVRVDVAQSTLVETPNTPELITTTGAGTWTKPAGVTKVLVECWGGGGSGGNSSVNDAGGGGGGGGGYARSIKTYPSDSQSIPYFVGAATQDTTWDNGEIAARAGTFGNDALNTTEQALGGFGGGFVPEGPSALQPNIGDVTYIGGDGANGWAIDALSGATAFSAGGGAAGSTGPGGAASPSADPPIGGTGTSEFGGNGADGTVANVNFVGLNGSNYGGGGSGAQKVSGPNRFGGAGAQGLIRITTYTITEANPPGVPIQMA